MNDKKKRPGLVLTVAAFLVILAAIAVYTFVARPWFLNWGAMGKDATRPLAGDEAWLGGVITGTRGVSIGELPETVWPWLVQIGQERAGFYSYTWLENLVLADIHNVLEVRPEWRKRQEKDFVRAAKPGYLFGLVKEGKDGGPGWKVAMVEEPSVLVLKNWGSFVLEPRFPGGSRLIARSKGEPLPGPIGRLASFWLLDPAHFVMEKRMLTEIKRLAEGRPGPPWLLELLAVIGFAAAAVGSALIIASRKRKSLWLLLPGAYALLILVETSDARAALVGFTALALAVLGFLVFKKRWWIFFGFMFIYCYTVLFLAPDAFIVFGLVFLAAFGALAALAAKGLAPR